MEGAIRKATKMALKSKRCRRLKARRTKGFSLIELMIVVAIVGILASLAIPIMNSFRLRSRRSEMYLNLRGVGTAQMAHYMAKAEFVDCGPSPTTPLSSQSHPFDRTVEGWPRLGWFPDGPVRCHYSAERFDNNAGFWVRTKSLCDLDDDNRTAEWWLDLDPNQNSPSSVHQTMRPSPNTERLNLY